MILLVHGRHTGIAQNNGKIPHLRATPNPEFHKKAIVYLLHNRFFIRIWGRFKTSPPGKFYPWAFPCPSSFAQISMLCVLRYSNGELPNF